MNDWIEILTFGMPPAHRKAAVNFMWRAAVTIHIAMACGWLAFTGFSGFASADEVASVRSAQVSAAVEILETRIFDTYSRQCSAETPEGRRYYAEKVQDLKLKYFRLTARDYPALPDCSVVR